MRNHSFLISSEIVELLEWISLGHDLVFLNEPPYSWTFSLGKELELG